MIKQLIASLGHIEVNDLNELTFAWFYKEKKKASAFYLDPNENSSSNDTKNSKSSIGESKITFFSLLLKKIALKFEMFELQFSSAYSKIDGWHCRYSRWSHSFERLTSNVYTKSQENCWKLWNQRKKWIQITAIQLKRTLSLKNKYTQAKCSNS